MENKKCSKCGEVKPVSGFSKATRNKDGLQGHCKSCVTEHYKANIEKIKEYKKEYQITHIEKIKERKKVYYQNNSEDIKYRANEYRKNNTDKIKDKKKDHYKCNVDAHILRCIKTRSKQKGIPFDLTIEDITYPEFCPVFGFKLQRNKGSNPARSSPSVDRIIPELGYVKGNIQMISQLANSMKSNATPEELLMFADWVIKTYRK